MHQYGGRLEVPIVYFIENNQFAVSTDIHTTCATPTLAQRAQGYGIEGIIVDGTDVLAVYEAMQRAVEHARSGKGPVLLECDVYRYTGHYVGDPAKYMSVEYNTAAHQNDVIDKFKTYLLAEGVASQGELDAVEAALAIGGEMTLDELIATIHSHPTVTETIREAALHAEKRAIHIKN